MRRPFMKRRSSGRPLRPMDWVASGFECGETTLVTACATGQAWYVIPPSVLRDIFTDPTLMTSLLGISGIGFGATSGASQFLFGLIDWDDVDDTIDSPPDPFNHAHADWIGVGQLPYVQLGGGTSIFGTTSERGDGIVQWRSRRRLGNNKGVLLSVVLDGPPGNTARFKFFYRGLIKE